MDVRKSKFDSSHTCIFLNKTDEKYAELKTAFKKYGLAFKKGKFIFFDETALKKGGYFNDVYITFIEAHEVSHSILGHRTTSKYIEASADFLAILLCKDAKYTKSAKLGVREFKSRNQTSFDDFSKKYKSVLLKKLKK